MNSKVIYGLFFIPAFLFAGCITEFRADLPFDNVQILMVDGSIMENTDAVFYLSRSLPLDAPYNPEEIFINNAGITIIGSDGYKSPTAINSGNGVYRIPVGELDDNVEYGIQIEYNGDIYHSTLLKPIHTPEIDSVTWTQPVEKGPIFFHVSTHDDIEQARFFQWNYTENWEIAAYNYTTIFYDPDIDTYYTIEPAPNYYCWKWFASNKYLIGSTESLKENRIINKQLFQGDPESDRFSVLYCITVYQKAISKGAFEYYQNKIVLNQEMGGLFTPQPSELTGNITCITNPSKRVMGYIDVVKNTTQKRIFINRDEIKSPAYNYGCELISMDSVYSYLNENDISLNYYYYLGYRPAIRDYTLYDTIVPDYWMRSYCTDCIASGGSKNKPDFWPNNHE